MKRLLVIVVLLVFSISVGAEEVPLIHTPWNLEYWEGTWEQEFCIEVGKFWNETGKNVGGWLNRIIQKDIDNHLKWMREQNEFLNLQYEDFPHDLKYYEELAEQIERPINLEVIIDHLDEQDNELQKREDYEEIKELKERLKHYQEYWKNHEDEINQMSQMTFNTVVLGILAILARLGQLVVTGS